MKNKKIIIVSISIIIMIVVLLEITILQLTRNKLFNKINTSKKAQNEIEEIGSGNIKFSYEILGEQENKAKILISVKEEKNGLAQIEFLDTNSIISLNNTKKERAVDYELELGKELNVRITSGAGEILEETILLQKEESEQYLYKEGNEYEDITGGWLPYYYGGMSEEATGNLVSSRGISWAKNTNNMYFYADSIYCQPNLGRIEWETQNKINVKNCTSIDVNCDIVGSGYTVLFIRLIDENGFKISGAVAQSNNFGVQSAVSKTITLDTKDYNGEYYIAVYLGDGLSEDAGSELTIHSIALKQSIIK